METLFLFPNVAKVASSYTVQNCKIFKKNDQLLKIECEIMKNTKIHKILDTTEKSFFFKVDGTGPEIIPQFSMNSSGTKNNTIQNNNISYNGDNGLYILSS